MSRFWRRLALATLLVVGAWHGAQGFYVEAKARLAQHLILRAWNATRAGRAHPRPWPWADTEPVARLQVPSEHVDLVILAGANGRTLAFGPGHLTGTPLPGEEGNSVVSGHRDTHFAFLARLQPGDEVSVERRDGQLRRYVVSGAEVVDKSEVGLILDHVDTRLTLVTCYPFAALRPGGPLRYVVTARLTAPPVGHSNSVADGLEPPLEREARLKPRGWGRRISRSFRALPPRRPTGDDSTAD